MTKHIVDHDHTPQSKSSRLKAYTRKERDDVPADATLATQRRKPVRGDGRIKAYTKIEREQA